MTLTVLFEAAEEGGYSVQIRELSGVLSQGETIDEARDMIVDALREMVLYKLENALCLVDEELFKKPSFEVSLIFGGAQ